jgi:hypothetical protein
MASLLELTTITTTKTPMMNEQTYRETQTHSRCGEYGQHLTVRPIQRARRHETQCVCHPWRPHTVHVDGSYSQVHGVGWRDGPPSLTNRCIDSARGSFFGKRGYGSSDWMPLMHGGSIGIVIIAAWLQGGDAGIATGEVQGIRTSSLTTRIRTSLLQRRSYPGRRFQISKHWKDFTPCRLVSR